MAGRQIDVDAPLVKGAQIGDAACQPKCQFHDRTDPGVVVWGRMDGDRHQSWRLLRRPSRLLGHLVVGAVQRKRQRSLRDEIGQGIVFQAAVQLRQATAPAQMGDQQGQNRQSGRAHANRQGSRQQIDILKRDGDIFHGRQRYATPADIARVGLVGVLAGARRPVQYHVDGRQSRLQFLGHHPVELDRKPMSDFLGDFPGSDQIAGRVFAAHVGRTAGDGADRFQRLDVVMDIERLHRYALIGLGDQPVCGQAAVGSGRGLRPGLATRPRKITLTGIDFILFQCRHMRE